MLCSLLFELHLLKLQSSLNFLNIYKRIKQYSTIEIVFSSLQVPVSHRWGRKTWWVYCWLWSLSKNREWHHFQSCSAEDVWCLWFNVWTLQCWAVRAGSVQRGLNVTTWCEDVKKLWSTYPSPSCLHTTSASLSSHWSSQTEPHLPAWNTSTRPSKSSSPPTNRSGGPLPERGQ